MTLRVCSCGRHVRASEHECPFCAAFAEGRAERASSKRRPRAAAFVCVAAVTVACAARTELGVVTSFDASARGSDGAENDGETHDANGSDVMLADGHAPDAHAGDAQVTDALDECVAIGGECTTNSDCCDNWCGFANRCGQPVPPYGSPVPP